MNSIPMIELQIVIRLLVSLPVDYVERTINENNSRKESVGYVLHFCGEEKNTAPVQSKFQNLSCIL